MRKRTGESRCMTYKETPELIRGLSITATNRPQVAVAC
jgi:hypothetical protein